MSQAEGLTFSFQKHLLIKYINFNILTSPELFIYTVCKCYLNVLLHTKLPIATPNYSAKQLDMLTCASDGLTAP